MTTTHHWPPRARRWAYKPGVNFYFEIKADKPGEENPVYMYETPEGEWWSS